MAFRSLVSCSNLNDPIMLNMAIYFFLELEQRSGNLHETRKGMILLVFRLLLVMLCSNKLLFFICSSALQDCSDFRFSIIFDISLFLDVDYMYQLLLGCNLVCT